MISGGFFFRPIISSVSRAKGLIVTWSMVFWRLGEMAELH
jgi:hypothetical protein